MSARALRIIVSLVLAGVWGAILGVAQLRGDIRSLEGVEATLADVRMRVRGVRTPPDSLTIVAIDDETVRRAGGYPLPRATLARIVASLASLQPRAIALDILFIDAGPGDGDRLLADALLESPSTIAAAAVFSASQQSASGEGPLAGIPLADRLLLPLPAIAEATTVGIVNVSTDRTGTPRFMPLLFRTIDRVESALALQAASIATASEPSIEPNGLVVGGRTIRTDIGQRLPLAFYGPRGTIRTISAATVLYGALSRGDIEGRVVVIGATVTGAGDVFPTPFDPVLPGVEVIATGMTHLLAGDGLVRDAGVRIADSGIAIALPVMLVGLLAWHRNAIGFGLIAAALLCLVVANVLAFGQGVWLSLALPAAAAFPPAFLFGASELWIGRRRAQHFATQSALLQRVQAPGMAKWLARDPDFLKRPAQQDAAIVFIDLSGFTGVSEALGANATRELIDAFYQLVQREADGCGGVITSFTGDGVMILFGLPAPSPTDASNAARCCVQLCGRTRAWLQSLPLSTSASIGFKVGAHFGEVVASRLGRGSGQQIAATGDTVNVASRLMEVAASRGAELALSDDMLRAAGPGAFEPGGLTGPIEASIRGRVGAMAVWLWSEDHPTR